MAKYVQKIVIGLVLVLLALPSLSFATADYVLDNESVYGFTGLLDSANEQTQAWFFSSDSSLTNQALRSQSFTFVNVVEESTGSNGILSWTSAAGYSNNSYYWGDGVSEPDARDGMSHGGLWSGSDGSMGLGITLEAGVEYIIELVSMQPSGGGVRTMDVSVDNTLLYDDWLVSEFPAYNTLLRFSGISDGIVNIGFTAGSYGDPAPAMTIVTVTPIPEPATLAILGLGGMFIRRRRA